MTTSKKDREAKLRLQGVHSLLSATLRKQDSIKYGIISCLALISAIGLPSSVRAQQVSRTQMVESPWTGRDGCAIVDLDSTQTRHSEASKKSRVNPIRQTQALTSSVADDLLGDSEIEANPEFDNVPLEDPTQLEDPLGSGQFSEKVVDPLETVPAVPVAPKTNSNTSRRIEASVPSVPDYGSSTKTPVYGQANAASNVSPLPQANSVNPYSRIGQAEYNPGYFYGGGNPNSSMNGYRNTPPDVAYGESLCGDSCYGCEGLFGGLLQNTSLCAGVDAMRSPIDFEDTGNVGGNFALNWGSVRPVWGGMHLQAGVRSVFTDLNGVQANGFSEEDCRSQLFWTAGAYYRANQYSTEGLSFGVVYDSLRDDYYRKYDLQQLRTEVSYTLGGVWSVGFRGAFSLNDDWVELLKLDEDLCVDAKATATDYYTAFLKKNFEQGGEVTVFGGVTEWSEGVVGGSIEAPLTDSFALKCSGTCVFSTDRGLTDREEECWNMSMGLVWYLGGNSRDSITAPRPLFDVADNGTFLQNFIR